MKKRIAIVGGGPAAVSACLQLLSALEKHQSSDGVEIIILEKGQSIGPGMPFSSRENSYVLNLPVEVLRGAFKEQGSFSDWVKQYEGTAGQTAFPPRYYFGDFLKDIASKLHIKASAMGIKLTHLTEHEVVDLDRLVEREHKYIVYTEQDTFLADYVILCTGQMPTIAYRGFIGHPDYWHNPKLYNGIDRNTTVYMIGTRLTAIDTALQLQSIGHRGKIIMISHSGLLPAVLAREIRLYPLKYLTLSNFTEITKAGLEFLPLDALLDLFWKEVSEAEGRQIDLRKLVKSYQDRSTRDRLRHEIKTAESNNKPYQRVLLSLHSILPNIWAMLSNQDKIIFLDKYNSLFLTYFVPLPLDSAYKILALLDSGQLAVKGGLRSVTPKADGFQVQTEDGPYHANVLLNATGPGYDISHSRFYQSLHEKGLVLKDTLGGIHLDPQTLKVKDADGNDHDRLYAAGAATKGACFFIMTMPRILAQLDRITSQIARKIQSDDKENDALLTPINQASFFNPAAKTTVRKPPPLHFFNPSSQARVVSFISTPVVAGPHAKL